MRAAVRSGAAKKRAVVDVDPRAEPAEDGGVRPGRGGRRCRRRCDGDDQADEHEGSAHDVDCRDDV